MSRQCRFTRAGVQCSRPAKKGWTTCPAHYTAGRYYHRSSRPATGGRSHKGNHDVTTALADTATEMVAAAIVDSQPTETAPADKPKRVRKSRAKVQPVERPAADVIVCDPCEDEHTAPACGPNEALEYARGEAEPVAEPISETETPAVTTLDVLELGRWYPHAGLDGIYRENDTEVHVAVRKSGLYTRGACGLPFRAGPIASNGRTDRRVCAECAAAWDAVVESMPADSDDDGVKYAIEQLAKYLDKKAAIAATTRAHARKRSTSAATASATRAPRQSHAPALNVKQPVANTARTIDPRALRSDSTYRGTTYSATVEEIISKMRDVPPGPPRVWRVLVDGTAYPPTQVVEMVWDLKIHIYYCLALLRAAGLDPQPVAS